MVIRKLIENYLNDAQLMQLATSLDDQPWVCSVWFAFDKELNLYWFSSTTRRHSKEVMKNNCVAAAIVFPQSPKDAPRGLQLQGTAKLLTKKEDIDNAIEIYSKRIFSKEKIVELMNSADSPHCFYKLKPTKFVLFDAVNFPKKMRQEYNL